MFLRYWELFYDAKMISGYTNTKQTKNKILDNMARVMLAWLIRCSTT